jgi:hypothetical protein
MHDVLVAIAFVAMLICPAIVASAPNTDTDDEI